MIVISDTTAVSTLIQLGRLDILRELFLEVIIPDAVFNELLELSKFGIDVSVLTKAQWLITKTPSSSPTLSLLKSLLDEGEASAIALAVELKADLIIIDEKQGRKIAQSMNLQFTGLGGVLIRAKQVGIIPDVKSFLDEVEQKTNFYLDISARAVILKGAGELP